MTRLISIILLLGLTGCIGGVNGGKVRLVLSGDRISAQGGVAVEYPRPLFSSDR